VVVTKVARGDMEFEWGVLEQVKKQCLIAIFRHPALLRPDVRLFGLAFCRGVQGTTEWLELLAYLSSH